MTNVKAAADRLLGYGPRHQPVPCIQKAQPISTHYACRSLEPGNWALQEACKLDTATGPYALFYASMCYQVP